jgi:hypothetical protein
MNQHSEHAMDIMKKHDPQSYAQIDDPESYFSALGEDIQQQIWDLSDQLIPNRGEEPPLEYVGLVNMAKFRARGQVYQEMNYASIPPEPEEMEEMEPPPSEEQ